MSSARNIIFLDFDGVLDTGFQEVAAQRDGHATTDKFGLLFDDDCVCNLEKIINATNADIVVTGTWKQDMSLDDIFAMWHYRNLPGRVIDATPNMDKARDIEIEEWLKAHDSNHLQYAIIDDLGADYFNDEQIRHLFIVNPYTGLDSDTADRVVNFFLADNSAEEYQEYRVSLPHLNIKSIEIPKTAWFVLIISALILIKIMWVSIAMQGIGSVDGEKGTILRRRNYLAAKVITTPKQVLEEMPNDIGEQFQGEWAIYTCSMFAQASANIAKLYPDQKERSISDIDKLISIVMSPELRHYDEMRWGSDPIEDTATVNSHISYISHLAWMISNYERAGGGNKYDETLRRLCDNMNRKILNSPNLNVPTYPNEPVYIPDMLVAIVALKAYDIMHGDVYESTISAWIENAKNKWTDKTTGIITSVLSEGSMTPDGTSIKGSYSALSCYYLSFVDYDFAKEQYENIKEHFLQTFPVTGLREYTGGFHPLGMDIDAGPIILNLSPSGTAFFIGCETAFGDKELRTRFLKTAEIAGSTLTWNGRSHYWLADIALVGESIALAMRTTTKSTYNHHAVLRLHGVTKL